MSPIEPLKQMSGIEEEARVRLGRCLFETPNRLHRIRQSLTSGDLQHVTDDLRDLRRLGQDSGDGLFARLCEDLEASGPGDRTESLLGEIEGRFVTLWKDLDHGDESA